MSPVPRPTRAARGFTLIEVVIVVALVGILAAIAVPAYSAYATNARRTHARVLLVEAAGEQVRFRSEFNRYAADLAELGYLTAAIETPEGGHYRVEVEPGSVTATGFELVATPVAGRAQAGDAECPDLRITATGRRYSSSGSEDCW